MKQLIFKIAFTVLSVILFYGCSTEPYDWSQGKPTEIEMIEISFPSITNESIQVGSYIKTTGKELEKIEFILQKYNGTEWVEIEKKQGIKSDKEEDYYVCDFNNLTDFTSYIVLVNVYSSFSTEPIYSNEFNIKTALDEYLLSTGDALDITDKTVTLVTEFSSEKIKPGREEIGIVYSENENEVKNNKSTFIPYTNNSDNLYLTSLSGLTPATTYYYCSCIIIDGQRIFSDDIRSFTLNEVEITQGELIDLGLSVKWMSYNLGANDIAEYGKYYGWGDPIGTGSMKSEDYPAYNNISGTGYDAAWYKLGTEYRIPTEIEWNELVENCQWEWVCYKNLYGYKVQGPSGNSIFLPAAGYRWMSDGGVGGCDIIGYYRIGTGINNYVYSFEIREESYSKSTTQPREWGVSIRPVYDNTVYCETGIASEITGTFVNITGSFKLNSNKTVSESGIWYGTTEYPHKEMGTMKQNYSGKDNINLNINGLSLNTTYYYCTYVVIDGITHFSKPNKFTTKDELEFSNNEPVDLGLSVKWAGCNLGATSAEQLGDTKHKWNELLNSVSTYPNEISGTEYDPAKKQLGGQWRLPTKEEAEELINKCTHTFTVYKGVTGYLITGSNGNSIFFPSVYDNYFNYMTGTINSLDSEEFNSYSIWYNNVGGVKMNTSAMYNSALIRPVQP